MLHLRPPMISRHVLCLVLTAAAPLALAACAPTAPPDVATPFPAATPASVGDAGRAEQPSAPVHVQILAFNDFHGHIEPPAGDEGTLAASPGDVSDGGTTGGARVPVGGAVALAAHVARLRAENPNTVVVSAGDLTGASPLVSNLFHDEPTVLAMNALGLDFEGVGNHDFDRGMGELRRLQSGGCADADCDAGAFAGAKFEYLAANVRDVATGKTVFPPYAIRDLSGVRVAFIGETLAQTPSVTTASAVQGLSFGDEADTANALVPELEQQGVSAIVLLLHQGGTQSRGAGYDSCTGLSGDILSILPRLSPAIRVVVSGHTHQAYDCVVDGRLVTSAGEYGQLLTKIDLTVDPVTRRVLDAHAKNLPVTRDVAPDPEVARILAPYEERAHLVVDRVVGWVKRDLTGSARRAGVSSCETPLGDVIADAMRTSTGADVAFMNPGGIRADLVAARPGRAPHAITFGDAFEVQPFKNTLVTMTLTGAQLAVLLERQFGARAEPRILQVSQGFAYRYHYDRATRAGKVTDLRIHGRPVDRSRGYRVTVPSFLAGGGDAFGVLGEGKERTEGAVDVDALATYLGKHGTEAAPMDAPAGGRIFGDACQ